LSLRWARIAMEDKDAEVVGFAAYVKGRWYLQGDHVDRIVAHE
jgi:hypothetical protein